MAHSYDAYYDYRDLPAAHRAKGKELSDRVLRIRAETDHITDLERQERRGAKSSKLLDRWSAKKDALYAQEREAVKEQHAFMRKHRVRIRENPVPAAEVRETRLALEQMPEDWYVFYQQGRDAAADAFASVLADMARELSQRFVDAVRSVEPGLRVVDAQTQDDLFAFYLTAPAGAFLWETGRERDARRILQEATQRLLALLGDSDLGFSIRTRKLEPALTRSWIESITWWSDAFEAFSREAADELYGALPPLAVYLLERDISDSALRQELLARAIDHLPIQGSFVIETGAFESADPSHIGREYGVGRLT